MRNRTALSPIALFGGLRACAENVAANQDRVPESSADAAPSTLPGFDSDSMNEDPSLDAAIDSSVSPDAGEKPVICGGTTMAAADVQVEVVGKHGSEWAVSKPGLVPDGTHTLVSFRIYQVGSGPAVTPYSLGKVRGQLELSGTSYRSLVRSVSGTPISSIFDPLPSGVPEFVAYLSDSGGRCSEFQQALRPIPRAPAATASGVSVSRPSAPLSWRRPKVAPTSWGDKTAASSAF